VAHAPSAAGVKYELVGAGSIDEKGLYSAPDAAKTPDHVSVKVVSIADPSKSALVPLTLAPVLVTAKATHPTVLLGGDSQLEAHLTGAAGKATGLRYSIKGPGTVDAQGRYLAPVTAAAGPVSVTVTSEADPSKFATVLLALAPVSVTVQPLAKPIAAGESVALVAHVVGATGEATGLKYSVEAGAGSVDASGRYTAPATLKTPALAVIQVASAADPSKAVKVSVQIPAVAVTAKAAAAQVMLGGETQLDAHVTGVAADDAAVDFTLVSGPGAIDEKGRYSAPKSGATPAKVVLQAAAHADPSKFARVELSLAPVHVAAKAENPAVSLGGDTQLSAQVTGVGEALGAVTYELVGPGSLDDKGHYSAPTSGATPAQATVKVHSVADPSQVSSVLLSIPAVAVSAHAANSVVNLGATCQIDASVAHAPSAAGVKYELVGAGSIDEKGLYSAPDTAKTPDHVSIKVVSIADPSKSALVPLSFAAVSVNLHAPAKPVLVGGSEALSVQVTGVTGKADGVTWSVPSGQGSIDAAGRYTAPAVLRGTPSAVTVRATSVADPSRSAEVKVPIAAVSVEVTPRVAALELGADAMFQAKVVGAETTAQEVHWAVVGGEKFGTIAADGRYTPPAQLTTPATVTVQATSAADPTRTALASVAFATVKVTAHAPSGPLPLGGSAKLEAQVQGVKGEAGVRWTVEGPGGATVDADGTYHAPSRLLTPATLTVRATSVADPSKSVVLPLAFGAVAVKLPAAPVPVDMGGSATLAAQVTGAEGPAAEVTWQVVGPGTIDAAGRYAPPATLQTPATVTVRATSVADPSKGATATVAIAAVQVAIAHAQASVKLGEKAGLQAEVRHASGAAAEVRWTVLGGAEAGTVDPDGTYHAPARAKTPGQARLRASSLADPSKSAEVDVAWPAVAVTLSPSSGRLALGDKLKLEAHVENAADDGFELSGGPAGALAADGTFTAPALLPDPPVVKLTARAKADPSKAATVELALAVADHYSFASEQRISGGQPGALLAGPPARGRLLVDGERVLAVYNDGEALLVPASDDRGVTFHGPKRLLAGKGPVAAPLLAQRGQGPLWVAYRSRVAGRPGDVVVCRTPDLLHAFDPCVKANGNAPVAGLGDHALAVASDGAAWVAWTDGDRVQLARSASGVSWTAQTFPAPGARSVALAAAPDGTVALAFVSTEGSEAVLSALAGKAQLSPVAGLTARAPQLDQVAVAVRGEAALAVAWTEGGAVRVATSTGGRAALGQAGAAQDFPAVAVDSDGLQLAFRERRAGGEAIRLARARRAFGAALAFEPPLSASTPGPATRGAPSLAVDSAGRAWVAWTDGRAGDAQGTRQDLFVARADEHPAQLSVTAPPGALLAGQGVQLQASVAGGPPEVRWSIDDGPGRGTVDAAGRYTAPALHGGSPHVYVRATSVADPSRSAAALVELAAPPELQQVAPAECGVGERVTLTGAHLGARYPGYGVTFGGVAVAESDYVSWTDTSIVVKLPAAAKSGAVELKAAGGTARAPQPFTFLPVAISVSPRSAVLLAGDRLTFQPAVQHTADPRVVWTLGDPRAAQLAEGVVSVDPGLSQVHRTTLQVASVSDPSQSATAELVTGPQGGVVWSAPALGARGPALAAGLEVITSGDGVVRGFDRAGATAWTTSLVAQDADAKVQLGLPVAAGERILVALKHPGSCSKDLTCQADSGTLVALDGRTGAALWRAELGDGDFADPVVMPGQVVVARYTGLLLAFDLAGGTKRWTATAPAGLSVPPRLGPDGLLHGLGEGGKLFAVTAAGQVSLGATLPGSRAIVASPEVQPDGSLFAVTDDGQLRALDPKGHARWTTKLEGVVLPRTRAAPLLGDGVIYVATTSTLEAFDLAGTRRWKAPCLSCAAPLQLGADGTVYAGRDGTQAFSPDGTLRWSGTSPPQGERWSPAALSGDGLLFWADGRGLSARIVPTARAQPLSQR
jgi:outer membrane protein assembly factor BamB